MNRVITSISLDEYRRSFSDWEEVKGLNTSEDVATFIDTFEEAKILGYMIAKVISKDGKYIFVTSERSTGFDFMSQLNNLTPDGVMVSAQNVKLLFGKEKSRGFYEEEQSTISDLPEFDTGVSPQGTEGDDNRTGILEEEEDVTATGFMDEDDYAEHGVENTTYNLVQTKTGAIIKIVDARGVTIGRSVSKVDFVVDSINVSRKHARVYINGKDCRVHDFESSNGTFVDGMRVRDTDVTIPVGGVLLLGDVEFKLAR